MKGLSEVYGSMEADLIIDILSDINSLGTSMASIFAENPSEDGGEAITSVQTTINNITSSSLTTGTMESVALAIAILFFFIATIELGMQERLTLDYFIKHFAKLGVACFFIFNASTLYDSICDFGGGLTTLMATNYITSDKGGGPKTNDTVAKVVRELGNKEGVSDDTREELAKQCSGEVTNFFDFIGKIFSTFLLGKILSFVSKGLLIICYVIAFSRLLELSIRGAFLPIAFALMSDDGWKGAGGRYIRKFVAICSQGAVLVAIGNVASMIISKVIASIGTGGDIMQLFVILIGVAIAIVSLMFKSIGIINDVFGA